MENRDSKWKRLYVIVAFGVAFAGWVGMDYIFEENLEITTNYLVRVGVKTFIILCLALFVNYKMPK
jgi:hypothetical protein